MSYDMPTFPDIPRHPPTFSDMSDKQGSTNQVWLIAITGSKPVLTTDKRANDPAA